jgi:hypothetical protein
MLMPDHIMLTEGVCSRQNLKTRLCTDWQRRRRRKKQVLPAMARAIDFEQKDSPNEKRIVADQFLIEGDSGRDTCDGPT